MRLTGNFRQVFQSVSTLTFALILASCGASTSEGGDFSNEFGAEFGEEVYQEGEVADDTPKKKENEKQAAEEAALKAKQDSLAALATKAAEIDSNSVALKKANSGECAAVLEIEKKKAGLLRDTIAMLKKKVYTLEKDNKVLLTDRGQFRENTDPKNPAPNTRVYFRIQISSVKASEGKKVYNGMEYMTENSGGYMRYMYGYFIKKSDAKDALSVLQRVGVKGAWIVKYVDGKRR